jgi:glycosyltransferase involved in cell wall biosynthesis
MRIGIDFTAAARQGAGIGRFTRDLILALLALDGDNEYRLAIAGREPSPYLTQAIPRTVRTIHLPLSERTLSRLWHRLRAPLPIELFLGRLDLFHSPDFVLPPVLHARAVLTVHDLSFLRVPECAEPTLAWYLRGTVPRSVRRADLLTADSECTRQDLHELMGVDLERIVVVPGGVEPRFHRVTDAAKLSAIRARYNLPWPFILAVGTIEPRKNYARLIHAFALAREQGLQEHRLVICGRKGWLTDGIFRAVEETGLREWVVFPGFVRDEDLPGLYSAADLFAMPSLYEGFGLPPLEAMACGTPTLVSEASSLPEVVGDAAIKVPPTDVEAMAAAIVSMLTDSALRARLSAAGPQQAAPFTWESAARKLLAAYQLAMER